MTIPMKDDGTPDLERISELILLCVTGASNKTPLEYLKALHTHGRASMQEEAVEVAGPVGEKPDAAIDFEDWLLWCERNYAAQAIKELKP